MDPRSHPTGGMLWRWNDEAGLVAFSSGDMNCKRKVICLGGLTDGLLPCPYTPLLTSMFCELGWSVVQPLLSSSYTGYGTRTLQMDSGQLSELVLHLRDSWGCEEVLIVGHSTGCQNAVHFAKYGAREAVSLLTGIVLQAPVSDQESGLLDSEIAVNLLWAREQPARELDSLMPISAHYTPITIRRFLSLYDKYGDDDFFSSYMTEEEMSTRLGHLHTLSNLKAVLVAYSLEDQYVPKNINKRGLVDKIVGAIGPKAISLLLEDGDHNLASPEDGSAQRLFVDAVRSMILKR